MLIKYFERLPKISGSDELHCRSFLNVGLGHLKMTYIAVQLKSFKNDLHSHSSEPDISNFPNHITINHCMKNPKGQCSICPWS